MTSQGCGSKYLASDCSEASLLVTWRVQYGIGTFFIVVLVFFRFFKLKESEVWAANKLHRDELKKINNYLNS